MSSILTPRSGKGIGFGLIFFSSNEAPFDGDKYRLVIESTKFADQHGFSSVWIPERHFTKDGWLYPNPAVLQAALARETRQIHLRAGSVVVPLHNPLRVAEEWAMVDNLSNGRVGISFASGWHPNDFALMPENYPNRNDEMYRGIETVRKLWRGETIQMTSGDGKLVDLKTYPPPIQPELPYWVTAAGNPKTFARAGEIGANLLTHMYNQSVDELAEKISIYRAARAEHGYDPNTGNVSVMMHTYIGPNEETVHAQLQGPFCEYLKSAAYLINAIAYSRGKQVDLTTLSEQDLQDYLLFVFNRLVSEKRVLFGTPETCRDLILQIKAAGVDEIACQLDFGINTDLALSSLPYLAQLKDHSNSELAQLVSLPLVKEEAAYPVHLNGHSAPQAAANLQSTEDDRLAVIQQRCRQEVAMPAFYQRLGERGIQLATSFKGIQRLWRRDGEALALVQIPASVEDEADRYQAHPTLLDACLQVVIATLPDLLSAGGDETLYLPTGIRSFQLYQRPGSQVWSHARLASGTQSSDTSIEGNVRILDPQGQLVAEALGIQLQRSEPVPQPTVQPVQTSVPSASQADLAQWLYELQWEPISLSQPVSRQQIGHWLIFMDRQGVGQRLVSLLQDQGATCITVVPGDTYRYVEQDRYQANPAQIDDLRHVVQDVLKNNTVRAVLHLWSLDATPAAETSVASLQADQVLGVGSALHVIQSLADLAEPPRLWLVTRGAQAVEQTATDLAISQAPLWGLGKTAAMEHPEMWGGLLDLDPQTSSSLAAAQVLRVLTAEHREDQLAFRQGQSYVARMVHSYPLPLRPLQLHQDASYLITGGLWGLGLEVAHWLAEKGARHLILLGRTKLPARASWDLATPGTRLSQQIAGLRSLEASGVHVHYASVDVADEEQLTTFFKDFSMQGQPPIRGIMHAASVWQDAQGQSLVRPLAHLNIAALRTVFQPKVIGSWLLHTLLKDQPLDFFVSFSSGASLFGSAAQGNYAAAGEFMDILAHHRRAQGQPALSIDWGAISEIGFGATPEGLRVHEYWESRGIQRINPQQVLAALELLLPQQLARVGVIKLDWQLLQQFYPQITALPLVSHLVSQPVLTGVTTSATAQKESSILQTLHAVGSQERLPLLEAYLCEQIAGVLRLPIAKLDLAQPLTVLGLDSLMAIELKNRLEHTLNVRIPIVTFLQGPSITQFTAQVFEQLNSVFDASNQELQPVAAVLPLSILQHQDANQLLSHIDLLSDQDVDILLNQLVEEEQGVKNNGQNGHSQSNSELSPQVAEQLLGQLDQLSDEQVDALLGQIAQKEDLN